MVPRLQLPGFQFLDRLAFGVRILALQFGRLLREVVFEHLQRHRLSMFVALTRCSLPMVLLQYNRTCFHSYPPSFFSFLARVFLGAFLVRSLSSSCLSFLFDVRSLSVLRLRLRVEEPFLVRSLSSSLSFLLEARSLSGACRVRPMRSVWVSV